MFNEMNMNEIMVVDGGHYTSNAEYAISNHDAAVYAAEIVGFLGGYGVAIVYGSNPSQALKGTALAVSLAEFVDQIKNSAN